MRCNLSQIKKAGAEEKQESSKLATLSRIKKERKKQADKTEMLTLYFQTAVSFDAQTKREAGGRGSSVAMFVSEMGFNRNTLYM